MSKVNIYDRLEDRANEARLKKETADKKIFINQVDTFQAEQFSLFEETIVPGNEFPTLMARLPIFPAMDREKQKNMMDKDNALVFNTVYGEGRRHGPPVNTDDEDRLLALMRLRSKKFVGDASQLPIPQNIIGNSKTSVHYTTCTVGEINAEMGLSRGGPNYHYTVECLKRLAAVSIEITTKKHDRYFGENERGTNYKLVDMMWNLYNERGIIKVQFPEIIARWLEQEQTYINWNQRQQLKSRNVKALHRYLSTQGKYHERSLDSLIAVIGWEGQKRRIKSSFEKMLDELVEIGFLESYNLEQRKKRMPLTLKITKR